MTPSRFPLLFSKFNAASIFRGGVPGVYLTPWDFGTMFQDAGMTTLVTAPGQTVAKMLDMSGNGNTATFTDATLEVDATGRYYIAFNGTSTFGLTGAINFTGTGRVTVIAGVLADISAAAIGLLVNHNSTGANAFSIQATTGVAGAIAAVANGATGSATAQKTGLSSPLSAVLTMTADIVANNATLRRNGIVDQSATGTMTGTAFANATLGIGRQNSSSQRFYKGNLYGLIVCGAGVNPSHIAKIERQFAARSGVSF
jgi:hypothetical protein